MGVLKRQSERWSLEIEPIEDKSEKVKKSLKIFRKNGMKQQPCPAFYNYDSKNI
jgi:hypothetical protein